MERAFIATKDSEYWKHIEKYNQLMSEQKLFIRKFFKENGIKTHTYLLSGNGFYNVPFDENDKKDIFLYIEPAEQDKEKFLKQLSKPDETGLYKFKGNSKIAKEFAQKCVDEKVIINIYNPSVRDYFNCLSYYGYNISQFLHNNTLYLKIISDYLKEDETPVGFKEIKISEFHKLLEEYNKNNN